jgi:hypothetical protein
MRLTAPSLILGLAPLAVVAELGCSSSAFLVAPDGGSGSASGSIDSGSGSGSSGEGSGAAASGSVGGSGSSSGSSSGGSGASSGSASSGSGGCASAGDSVTFEMSVAPGIAGSYCYGGNCTDAFVTVHGPSGELVATQAPTCTTTCSVCEPLLCPALCEAPGRLTATGVTQTWDGTVWQSQTCGAGVACTQTSCASSGHYVATLCASTDTSGGAVACALSQSQTCNDFPFDWPPPGGSMTIHWVIGEPDGGAPPADAGVESCRSTADCGSNEICGFPKSPVCATVGQCFPAQQVTCNAFAPGCACDGTEINVVCNGLPDGYETKPLRHTGTCIHGE